MQEIVPSGKWFHLVQRSNLLRCKGLWGLRCCRSVWGVWSFHTSSDLRRSSLLWLFFFSLFSCCSLSPSTWVASSPTSSPNSKGSSSNLSKNTTLDQIWPNNVKTPSGSVTGNRTKQGQGYGGSGKVSTFGGFRMWVRGRRVIGDPKRSDLESGRKNESVCVWVCVWEKKMKKKRVKRGHLISQICGSNWWSWCLEFYRERETEKEREWMLCCVRDFRSTTGPNLFPSLSLPFFLACLLWWWVLCEFVRPSLYNLQWMTFVLFCFLLFCFGQRLIMTLIWFSFFSFFLSLSILFWI